MVFSVLISRYIFQILDSLDSLPERSVNSRHFEVSRQFQNSLKFPNRRKYLKMSKVELLSNCEIYQPAESPRIVVHALSFEYPSNAPCIYIARVYTFFFSILLLTSCRSKTTGYNTDNRTTTENEEALSIIECDNYVNRHRDTWQANEASIVV